MTHTPAEIAAGRALFRLIMETEDDSALFKLSEFNRGEWIDYAMTIVHAHAALAPPTWPAPRPIAEARPEMGEILGWDGTTWRRCVWIKPTSRWQTFEPYWMVDQAGIEPGTGRAYFGLITHFLPMPTAPGAEP